MAVYFLLGLVLGIILGTFLAELMRSLVTILLRDRAKRSLEALITSYKDGLAGLGSDQYNPYMPLRTPTREEKPN